MTALGRIAARHHRRIAYRRAVDRLHAADVEMQRIHAERRAARALVRQLGRGL